LKAVGLKVVGEPWFPYTASYTSGSLKSLFPASEELIFGLMSIVMI